jgi:hypothetical protein
VCVLFLIFSSVEEEKKYFFFYLLKLLTKKQQNLGSLFLSHSSALLLLKIGFSKIIHWILSSVSLMMADCLAKKTWPIFREYPVKPNVYMQVIQGCTCSMPRHNNNNNNNKMCFIAQLGRVSSFLLHSTNIYVRLVVFISFCESWSNPKEMYCLFDGTALDRVLCAQTEWKRAELTRVLRCRGRVLRTLQRPLKGRKTDCR